jgi:pre-mRNA-splicing factor ATP-dependent RNA helicase DHX16
VSSFLCRGIKSTALFISLISLLFTPYFLLLLGFFYHTAKLGKSGDYQTIKQKRTVHIHPSSVLAKEEDLPGWLVYFELAFTTKEFMRQVAPIQPGWLVEIAPHFYQESDIQDSSTKKMPKVVKNRAKPSRF